MAESHEERIDAPQQGELAGRLVNFDDVQVSFSNVVHINNDQSMFQVVFSQFTQPVFTRPEDAQRVVDQGYVPIKVVARLVMTPKMLRETIQVMTKQLEDYGPTMENAPDTEGSNA